MHIIKFLKVREREKIQTATATRDKILITYEEREICIFQTSYLKLCNPVDNSTTSE